ncbi:hypothetical protein [Paenibacillus sp. N3.4]|uniref:hypothetical protein n=1 Tax=Paenibacillus sp. N3.4 TaxID=2603222 RepID=UPI0011C9B8B0|nr:hypothetical protein [Paenibacillus sp. N3.4]TXK84352.1 hypothetical protein FU659_08945 [Paenibacillus sp. N3.4]
MRKLVRYILGFTLLLMITSCKPAFKTDISSLDSINTTNEKQTAVIELKASNPPTPLATLPQPTNPPNVPKNTPNEVHASKEKFNLAYVRNELKSQTGIFDITESPNKKYVAYMHSDTNSQYDPLTLHIWRVGDDKPQETQEMKEETVGDVIWSPNSEYIFVDTGTYVTRAGDLFVAEGVKKVVSLGYLHSIYFSPNGKKILYSKLNRDVSTLKGKYVDPFEAFDLVMYDIATNKEEMILKGTETEDSNAIGWLDSQTISYNLIKYSEEKGELQEENVKYKYDVKSKKSIVDEPIPGNKITLTNYWKITKSLSEQKDVFEETWSPDQRTIIYAKGNKKEGHGQVWIWRWGEEKPISIYEEEMLNKFVWSSDSRFFIFSGGISSEEQIKIVDAHNGNIDKIGCFCLVDGRIAGTPYFFSPDSKLLLFSGVEEIRSTYKMNTETGNSHNVSIMNMDTKEIKILFKATDKIDYVALGWSGENKVVYKKLDYEQNSDEILEYTLLN